MTKPSAGLINALEKEVWQEGIQPFAGRVVYPDEGLTLILSLWTDIDKVLTPPYKKLCRRNRKEVGTIGWRSFASRIFGENCSLCSLLGGAVSQILQTLPGGYFYRSRVMIILG